MALRRYLTALTLAGCFLASPAWAASVVVQDNNVERVIRSHENLKPWWVSHSDCVGDDVITFPVDLTGQSGNSLEVWAGKNCTDKVQREGDQATCWKLHGSFPQKATVDVKVRAQDFVAQKVKDSNSVGGGTDADCNRTDVPPAGEAATLYFMLINSNNEMVAQDTFESGFDVLGPDAPTDVSAGVGENRLVVSWTASTAEDRAGYNIYCESSTGPGSSPAAGGAAGAAADAGADAATDAGSDATSTGSGGADSGSGGGGGVGGGSGGGSAGNPDCPSAALTPGTIPTTSEHLCGSTASGLATEANATGLVNGVTYAVAVAATDTLGNVGPLSKVACGSPQPVDDFFELYRRAGGKGGGGFCAIGAEPSSAGLALAGLALGAWLVRRRRRDA